eukprot:scaffold14217_cov120-Isochrysis_galbana.AAC.7
MCFLCLWRRTPAAIPPRGPPGPQWDIAENVPLPGTCEKFGSALAMPGIRARECPDGTWHGRCTWHATHQSGSKIRCFILAVLADI